MVWAENGDEPVVGGTPVEQIEINDINNKIFNTLFLYINPNNNNPSVALTRFNDILAQQYTYTRIIGTGAVNSFITQNEIDFHFNSDNHPYFTVSPFDSDTGFDLKAGVSWQIRSNGSNEAIAPTRQRMTWKWINNVAITDIEVQNLIGGFFYGSGTSALLVSDN